MIPAASESETNADKFIDQPELRSAQGLPGSRDMKSVPEPEPNNVEERAKAVLPSTPFPLLVRPPRIGHAGFIHPNSPPFARRIRETLAVNSGSTPNRKLLILIRVYTDLDGVTLQVF